MTYALALRKAEPCVALCALARRFAIFLAEHADFLAGVPTHHIEAVKAFQAGALRGIGITVLDFLSLVYFSDFAFAIKD